MEGGGSSGVGDGGDGLSDWGAACSAAFFGGPSGASHGGDLFFECGRIFAPSGWGMDWHLGGGDFICDRA